MTQNERAEKIFAIASSHNVTRDGCIKMIDAQIQEAIFEAMDSDEVVGYQIRKAVEDHRCDQTPKCRTVNDNCIYWAKKEAYADAAKIAESLIEPDYAPDYFQACADVAEKIRARAAELDREVGK